MKGDEKFRSRWGLLASALGMAIGTGNIWRFPRVIAGNGGGAFLIPYIIFLFMWAIPLLMVEFVAGSRMRKGLFGVFYSYGGRGCGWMGGFVAMVTFFILSYYAVVTGWCIAYMVKSAFAWKVLTTDSAGAWEIFSGSGLEKVVCQLTSIICASGVIYLGVVRGIEVVNKVLIPSVVVLLLILVAKAISLEGSGRGIDFLFVPEFKLLLKPRTWLEALSQSAWSTGAGWGLFLVYATYSSGGEDRKFISTATGIGDSVAAILAATAIIPTIFALLPIQDATKIIEGSNQGLAFISIPGLFGGVTGGRIFSFIFFTALFFAAFSSLISMFELGVKSLGDFGISRKVAVIVVAVFSFVMGLPSAISMKFFNNQDWVWGLALIISGLFFSILVWRSGEGFGFFKERGGEGLFDRWSYMCVSYVVPVLCFLLLGWWLYMAIVSFDPYQWWNPFRQFSAGTCVVQWLVLAVSLIALWRWFLLDKIDG